MTQPEALLEAYRTSTGLPVHLSQQRMMWLTELVQRGIEPQDIREVVKELQKLIKRDTKGFYTDVCLQFRCCMEPDKMEERALSLRQRKQRLTPKPDQVPKVVNLGPDNITLLSDHVPEEPRRTDAAQALRGMADQITKKAS